MTSTSMKKTKKTSTQIWSGQMVRLTKVDVKQAEEAFQSSIGE